LKSSATIDIRAYRCLKSAHESWYETGDYHGALTWVDKALAFSPDFVEALLLKADLLYESENEDEALTLLDDMLAITPDCLEAYLSKVVMLMTMGKYRLALLICQEALFQARRSKKTDEWMLPYLFRHKITLQMLLHRYWAAKLTLKQAQPLLETAEVQQLTDHLYRQRKAHRQSHVKRHKLNVV
jgi:tetratricopeptide (TPR) repeat protein